MSDYFFSTVRSNRDVIDNLNKKSMINNYIYEDNMLYIMYCCTYNVESYGSKIIVLFDGVIYDNTKSLQCDVKNYLVKLYLKYGPKFTQYIDGEFSICLIDLNQELCIFSTDVFGTRPIYFTVENGNLSLCTYLSVLSNIKGKKVRAKPNTTYIFNLNSNILTYNTVYEFSLVQYKNFFDDWNLAFEKSISKRINGIKSIIPLSSGYDSGAICCEAIKQKGNFQTISFIGKENMDILTRRIKLCNNNYIFNYTKQEYYNVLKNFLKSVERYEDGDYDLIHDESSIGLGLICEYAQKQNINILISGTGADSIYSYTNRNHYIIEDSINNYCNVFPNDLNGFFPWENFFGGNMQRYLFQEEYISKVYNIQIRYPFLDKQLVQEFLWLDTSLKNKLYKSPIQNYFDKNSFPYDSKNKIGFYI